VSVVRHATNLGLGAVLRQAFRPSDRDAVVLLCGDLQFAPEDVFALVRGLKDADLVTALRAERKDNAWRRLNTAIDRSLTRVLFGRTFPDVHWVRAVRSRHLGNVEFVSHSPMVDLELALAVRRGGGTLASLALPHYPRTRGQASGAKWSVIAKSFADLLRVAVSHHGRRWRRGVT
jgi:glycosyltransferase involved in cell wall biosynthesis